MEYARQKQAACQIELASLLVHKALPRNPCNWRDCGDCYHSASGDGDRNSDISPGTARKRRAGVSNHQMALDLRALFNVDPDRVRDAEEILRPFDSLVPIIVEGNEIKLPNNNSLWRGMQFWGLMTGEISIDFGLFCIAGTCKNCKTRIRRPGDERKLNVLACQTIVEPGLEVVRLAPGFRITPRENRPPGGVALGTGDATPSPGAPALP
jgi:hypothetical protein